MALYKVELYGYFQQYFTAHGQKRFHMNFWWKLDNSVRISDRDFFIKCEIATTDPRFPLISAFCMLKVRHIFTSVFLSYWPKKYTTCVQSHDDNFDIDWSWYDHPLPSHSVLDADTLRDLWPWPLTFWPSSIKKCVFIHCACIGSRDMSVGCQKQLHKNCKLLKTSFDLLTDRLMPSVTDRLLIKYGILLQRPLRICACVKTKRYVWIF